MCLLEAVICSSCKINALFQIFPIRKSQDSQKGLKLIELFHVFVYYDDDNSCSKKANSIKNSKMILQANNRRFEDEKEPHV
jgi:hypothetical protein